MDVVWKVELVCGSWVATGITSLGEFRYECESYGEAMSMVADERSKEKSNRPINDSNGVNDMRYIGYRGKYTNKYTIEDTEDGFALAQVDDTYQMDNLLFALNGGGPVPTPDQQPSIYVDGSKVVMPYEVQHDDSGWYVWHHETEARRNVVSEGEAKRIANDYNNNNVVCMSSTCDGTSCMCDLCPTRLAAVVKDDEADDVRMVEDARKAEVVAEYIKGKEKILSDNKAELVRCEVELDRCKIKVLGSTNLVKELRSMSIDDIYQRAVPIGWI